MKYRMYYSQIKIGAMFILALGLSSCANTPYKDANGIERQPSSVQEEEGVHRSRIDGREPSSMKGDFTWLNEVEDEFGRVAAETTSRVVASQNKHEVLMKQKEWSFSYLPKTNHFYVELQGTQYQMVQTKIGDGERFAFAASGQAENPLTFAVTRDGRSVASAEGAGGACATEISYWSQAAHSYVTDRKSVSGKPCERLLGLLKDYVP